MFSHTPYKVPRCPHCLFCFTGLPESENAVCAECGTEIDWERARRRRREFSILWQALVIIAAHGVMYVVFAIDTNSAAALPIAPHVAVLAAPLGLLICGAIYYGRMHDNFRGRPLGGWIVAALTAAPAVVNTLSMLAFLLLP